SADAPVRLADNSKIVAHVVPLSPPTPERQVDLHAFGREGITVPLLASPPDRGYPRFNLDGFWWQSIQRQMARTVATSRRFETAQWRPWIPCVLTLTAPNTFQVCWLNALCEKPFRNCW